MKKKQRYERRSTKASSLKKKNIDKSLARN